MEENKNALSIINSYPASQYNSLIPIDTIAKIPEVQSPVINAVRISKDLDDKEIYVQEKARQANSKYPSSPAKYALSKKGLTKLAEAAGIKQVSSEPVLPSTCQKCATVNKNSGKFISCGQCGNRDVKYKVTISVPQLTGEVLYFTDHHEINVETVTVGMTDNQKKEFLKHLAQICEAKAMNGAIRTALQIKGTYLLEEFDKPFVVAYLVPNMDNPDVKRVAIESMFSSSRNLFGEAPRVKEQYIEEAHSKEAHPEVEHEKEVVTYEDVIDEPMSAETPPQQQQTRVYQSKELTEADRVNDFCCDKCGNVIARKVWDYSIDKFERPLCYKCQRIIKREQGDN